MAPLDGPDGEAAQTIAQNTNSAKPASASRQIASTSAPPPRATSSRLAAKSPSTETGRLIHRVRKGESLSVIASAYNTSVRELRRDNQHLGKILQIGDPVYIPAPKK
ncbi:MAG: LysM peptidoglycan-binding domain-containing protein [Acidobacteria bacterium]|nr:LysM peptidoglycan-binding domain-containing protein [Acidobacteriota bacterium]